MTEYELKIFKRILKAEGLKDWQVRIKNMGGGGLCRHQIKSIDMCITWAKKYDTYFPLFLHELAHALLDKNQGHDGVFADKFTYLVYKYMRPEGDNKKWKQKKEI